jgi:hypothetical protein
MYIITYARSIIELHVCLYACFYGYMLMMLWSMLEASIWYIVEALTHA